MCMMNESYCHIIMTPNLCNVDPHPLGMTHHRMMNGRQDAARILTSAWDAI